MGFPFLSTKTKCTFASTINSSSLEINCDIKKEVFVIDLTKDLIFKSSSR